MKRVVGGLITSNDNFRQYFNITGYTGSTDFNDYYPTQGVSIYVCGGGSLVNGPVSKPFGVIFSCSAINTGAYNIQVFFGFDSHIYYRHGKETSWVTVV